MYDIIAVSMDDSESFGCPYCGYGPGTISVEISGTIFWRCAAEDCQKLSIVLEKGLRESSIRY